MTEHKVAPELEYDREAERELSPSKQLSQVSFLDDDRIVDLARLEPLAPHKTVSREHAMKTPDAVRQANDL